LQSLSFYKPDARSAEMRYLHQRASALGGYMPARPATSVPLAVPDIHSYAGFAIAAEGKEMSTTMAFVRMLSGLLQGQATGTAHRADRRRRSAHLRHGQSVQADRYLLQCRPAL
jgi:pyruvate dehydrogenase complex dehydrogenase (E1) component